MACGFGRTEPAPARGELAELYRNYYPRPNLSPESTLNSFRAARDKKPLRLWWEGAGTECYRRIRAGGRVLDVGCGDCTSLLMSAALGARDVIGIEVDPNLRKIAEALSLNLHVGQLGDLPEGAGRFDFILGRQMLEHEPEPVALLSEMKRRLAPGGRIVLSFPSVDSVYRRLYRERWLHWHVPFHVNHFSRRSIAALAAACGLRADTVRTVTPNSWTLYQRRFAAIEVARGQRDGYWDPPDYKSSIRDPRRRPAAGAIGDFLTACFNRLADALGLGDSFVVVLSAG